MTRNNLILELFVQAAACKLIVKSSPLPLMKRAYSVSPSFLSSQPVSGIAMVLIAAFLIIGVGTTSSAGSFSSELSQLAWFYKPPSDGNLDTLAKNFDNYLLTTGDEDERESLKRRGVTEPFLMYMRFEAIESASCSETPHHNQAAYKRGDYCNINKYHSDWFLVDKYGKRFTVNGYYMMDPGNSGWRSFFLSRLKSAMESRGWDGVFLDNVDASIGRFRYRLGGRYPRKYSDEASYVNAIRGMLSYIRSNLGRTVFANVTHAWPDNINWFKYLDYLHGAMSEGLIVDWDSGWLSTDRWEANIRRIEKTQSMGRRIIVVSQGSKYNTFRQTFAYASYLLAANGKAAFRYSDASQYRSIWLYNNYNIDLGTPLGSRYYSNGWWKRDFTKGKVSVNPRTHEAKISGSTSTRSSTSSTSSKVYVQKEAESGSLDFPMIKSSSSSASGGYCASIPNGAGNYRGKGVYSISVNTAGTYYLWGRTIAPGYSSDSFSVRVDGGSTYTWDLARSTSWAWRKYSRSIYLSSGTHTFEIKGREDGTKLDRLIVTNDSNYQP